VLSVPAVADVSGEQLAPTQAAGEPAVVHVEVSAFSTSSITLLMASRRTMRGWGLGGTPRSPAELGEARRAGSLYCSATARSKSATSAAALSRRRGVRLPRNRLSRDALFGPIPVASEAENDARDPGTCKGPR
jgi:hypothetical protein